MSGGDRDKETKRGMNEVIMTNTRTILKQDDSVLLYNWLSMCFPQMPRIMDLINNLVRILPLLRTIFISFLPVQFSYSLDFS